MGCLTWHGQMEGRNEHLVRWKEMQEPCIYLQKCAENTWYILKLAAKTCEGMRRGPVKLRLDFSKLCFKGIYISYVVFLERKKKLVHKRASRRASLVSSLGPWKKPFKATGGDRSGTRLEKNENEAWFEDHRAKTGKPKRFFSKHFFCFFLEPPTRVRTSGKVAACWNGWVSIFFGPKFPNAPWHEFSTKNGFHNLYKKRKKGKILS